MSSQAYIKQFFEKEAASGIILVLAAIVALVLANTPFDHYYNLLIDTLVRIQVGDYEIAKPLLLWVNDGLMAIFFFLIGLELKREWIEGELSDRKNIILPGLGALGGMLFPALIYAAYNYEDPVAIKGWAIPAATDIAFVLGVLALLGSRVPTSLKIFLTSLAIFDDIGAILIIAVFYTNNISMTALIVAAFCVSGLFFLNRRGVAERSLYIFLGMVMWVAFLKSGVHATLSGVVLAMFIPLTAKGKTGYSPLKSLEHDLHSVVAFVILPVFAFCNSGVSFSGMGIEDLMHNVPLGIALGLFLGKQLGVFGLCYIGVKMGIASLPSDISIKTLYGASILTGIGFTMSLFIGSLAFEETGVNLVVDERIGIIVGSLLSGLVGYFILRKSLAQR